MCQVVRGGMVGQGTSFRAALPFPDGGSSALPGSENPCSHSGKMKGKKIDTSGPKPSLGLWAEQALPHTDRSICRAAPRPLCWVWAALRLDRISSSALPGHFICLVTFTSNGLYCLGFHLTASKEKHHNT